MLCASTYCSTLQPPTSLSLTIYMRPGRTPSTQADRTTVSGEAPEEPVVSKKTGTVFEKRLIEKYIEENGKDPITGDELDPEDLLPIQSARVVRPRAPNLTSIPALLSTFQNEWDALALETFKLKQQLSQTRDELANALYQHDAAVRVIARVTRERDEARAALSRVTVSAGSGSASGANGDAMAVDNETLPEELAAHVDETQAKYVTSCWNDYYAPPPILTRWKLQVIQEPQEEAGAQRLGQLRRDCDLCATAVRVAAGPTGVVNRAGSRLRGRGRPEGGRGHLLDHGRHAGAVAQGG